MLIVFTVIINSIALYVIFHYFKWKLTSYSFLDGYEKKKEEINREIEQILVEINRTTERNLQILEAKISQLNEAASRAEKLFNAIRKEKEGVESSGEIYQKLERKSIREKLDKLGKLNEEKSPYHGPESTTPSQGAQPDDIREKVISMYKNGIDIELISRNLGITAGEAELIISISKIK